MKTSKITGMLNCVVGMHNCTLLKCEHHQQIISRYCKNRYF